MRYLLILSSLLMLSCAGMKSQQSGAGQVLAGSNWTLNSIPDFPAESTSRPVTLSFSDSTDRFGGNTGCNGFGGNYEVKGNRLTLSKIISTQMACNPGMQTESRLMKALTEADGYEIRNDKLILRKGDQLLITFDRNKKD
jgi:heat shock protein HslJ